MLQFEVDAELCAACGLCADDCPTKIISMETGQPAIAPEREENCLRCQHCMAVCPSGAISILGVRPEEMQPLPERFPDLPALETLIRGRRSVRNYKDENVDPALLAHLLEVAWQAPTGKNDRQVQFTVVDDRKKMAALRTKVMRGIGSLAEKNALPEKLAFYANFARKWEEHGTDIIFRGAPHLLIATAPLSCATPTADCLIALTTFDLFAQAHGLGTAWVGYANWAIDMLVPEVKQEIGIPADHVFGYCMIFGNPAVQYARTVRHKNALIHRVG
ncbi:MAG: nitroreductase family protein [Terracidiphilus sp.]|nr:nitroreductase family protein [Terracidiphilus sp.]MDR3775934.1 nitroreductase family protein [Terracidiphilus sp.]